ncbi:MAG: hypothetical protein ACYDEB_09975, partial [Dehalococcoidia bacterium]
MHVRAPAQLTRETSVCLLFLVLSLFPVLCSLLYVLSVFPVLCSLFFVLCSSRPFAVPRSRPVFAVCSLLFALRRSRRSLLFALRRSRSRRLADIDHAHL